MKAFKPILSLFVLLGGVNCAPKVGLNINGRPSEYLSAWLEKHEEGYLIFAELPMGNWEVKLARENFVLIIEDKKSRQVVKWKVSRSRLSESTPFRLELKSPGGDGPAIVLEVQPKYAGQGFLEGALNVVSWFAKK